MAIPTPPGVVTSNAVKGTRQTREGEQTRIPIQPRAPRYYAHEIGEYEVGTIDGDPVFLPVLVAHHTRGGVNNHRPRQGTETMLQKEGTAIRKASEGGFKVLYTLDPKYKGPQYLVGYDTVVGGKFWTCMFESIQVRRGKVVRGRFKRDAYDAFRLECVRCGELEAPGPEDVAHLLRRGEAKVERIRALVNVPEDRRKRMLSMAEDELETLEEAYFTVKYGEIYRDLEREQEAATRAQDFETRARISAETEAKLKAEADAEQARADKAEAENAKLLEELRALKASAEAPSDPAATAAKSASKAKAKKP